MTDPSQYFKGRTVQEQMNEVIGYVDVRSAEVATDAIASDVAQVHQDMLDADADAAAAAASAAAAAGTLANAVKKTGEASQSIDGDIDLNDDLNVDGDATIGGALSVTGAVTVPTPVNNTDAATKKYVDDADALKLNIADVNSYAVGLTGNQSPIVGEKNFLKLMGTRPYIFVGATTPSSNNNNRTNYYRVLVIDAQAYSHYRIRIIGQLNNTGNAEAEFLINYSDANNNNYVVISNKSVIASRAVNVKLTVTTSGIEVWVREGQYTNYVTYVLERESYGAVSNDPTKYTVGDGAQSADPTTEAGYQSTISNTTYGDYAME